MIPHASQNSEIWGTPPSYNGSCEKIHHDSRKLMRTGERSEGTCSVGFSQWTNRECTYGEDLADVPRQSELFSHHPESDAADHEGCGRSVHTFLVLKEQDSNAYEEFLLLGERYNRSLVTFPLCPAYVESQPAHDRVAAIDFQPTRPRHGARQAVAAGLPSGAPGLADFLCRIPQLCLARQRRNALHRFG